MKNIKYVIIGGIIIIGIVAFSLRGFFGSGKLSVNNGVVCVMDMAGDAGIGKTVYHFYKDKIRYDTTINHMQGGVKEMHAIQTKDKIYVWGNMFHMPGTGNLGFIIPKDDKDGAEMAAGFEPDELVKNSFQMPGMKCTAWEKDENMFELPKNYVFKTQQEAMNQMMQGALKPKAPSATAGFMSCEICKQIPNAEAKKQCEKQCKK